MSLKISVAKLVLIAAAAVIIGLPIVHSAQVVIFLGLIVWVALGSARLPPPGRAALWLVGIFALIAIGLVLPEIRMQEGHNMFLVDGERHETALKAALPDGIYEYAKAQFLKFHPPESACSDTVPCWRGSGRIEVPYAFSADGALQAPAMSKVTDFPNFEGLANFRAGFRNWVGRAEIPDTNWYESESGPSDPTRATMPFFVVYLLPQSLVGQDMCVKGERFLVRQGQAPIHEVSLSGVCRRIAAEDAGAHFYGLSIDPRLTLAVNFRVRPTLAVVLHFARLAARTLAAVGLVLMLIAPVWLELSRFAIITALPAIAAGFPLFKALESPFYSAGDDPLTHWGFGERILQEAATGHWWEALQGVEPVFYYMPGYRYVHALEMTLFGDSAFLSFAAIMVYPFLIVTLAKRLGGDKLALAALSVAYVAFGVSALGYQGLAESVAYPLVVLAMSRALSVVRQDDKVLAGPYFVVALLLAGATMLRPNLGLATIAITGAMLALRPERGLSLRILAAGLGLAPIGLLLVHNLVFGGRFVLATDAASVDLVTSPIVYGRALLAAITANFDSADLSAALNHLGLWISGGGGLPILAFGAVVAVAVRWLGADVCWSVLMSEGRRPEVIVFLAALVGLELPLLFFGPTGRYASLAALVGALLVLQVVTVLADKAGVIWTRDQFAKSLSGPIVRLLD